MGHESQPSYREPVTHLPPTCTEHDLSTLLHIIRLLPTNDLVGCHFLDVLEAEVVAIRAAWPYGWDQLCRLIEAEKMSAHHPSRRHTTPTENEEEEALVRNLTHLSVDEHEELSDLIAKMHVSNHRVARYATTYDLANLYFLCCSLTRRGRSAASLTLEQLHRVRIKHTATEFLERRYVSIVNKWPSPLIGHTSSIDLVEDHGINKAQYIPFISLMIWRQLFMDRDFTNWAVLFWVGETLNTAAFTDMGARIKQMDETIEKIIVVLPVIDWFLAEEGSPDLEDIHDSSRILSILISRSLYDQPFVTMLDRRWTEPQFGKRIGEYIKLMRSVGDAAGMSPVNIVLSRAACGWVKALDADEFDYVSSHNTCRFFDDRFLPLQRPPHPLAKYDRIADNMEWLTEMLQVPIITSRFYWDDTHRAEQQVRRASVDPAHTDADRFTADRRWLKLFEPAMYITVCIGEHHYMQSPNYITAHMDEMFEIVSTVNLEIAASVLAGDFLLTPASLTYLLHRAAPASHTGFHVIDGQANPPAVTYAWALSAQSGTRTVSCMRHHPPSGQFDTAFVWDEEADEMDGHALRDSASNTKALLMHLRKTADSRPIDENHTKKRTRTHNDAAQRTHKR